MTDRTPVRTTKIIATLGPATSSRERISELIRAGIDVARINFSHGEHAEHAERIAIVRDVAKELGLPIAILQDLQGPKIRTGSLRDGRAVQLVAGIGFSAVVGFCANDWRRAKLHRQGYRLQGVVAATDMDSARRRWFDLHPVP